MQVLNGDPGSAGVPMGRPANPYLRAPGEDGFLDVAEPGRSSGEIVTWLPERRQEPFGPVAGQQAESMSAPSSDYPAARVPKDWPGAEGEVFEPAHRESPARLVGPVQFILKLLEQWRLETGDAAVLLGYDQSDTDYVHSVLEGRERLRGKDVRDRIFHLYGIRRSLRFLFQDLETENTWLREPHQELNGKSPMSLLLSGSMESLLTVKDYVNIFAGR